MSKDIERKPRQNPFAVRLGCFHEAGHVVVGHATGWECLWVKTHQAYFEPVVVPLPFLATSKAERSRRVAALRRVLTTFVAGHIASTIHQFAVAERGFGSRQESRAYSGWWEFRVSNQFGIVPLDDPGSDLYQVVANAEAICLAEELDGPRVGMKAREKRVRAEIVRLEEKAERILRRRWQAVEDVATALHRSKSGRLTRGQLLRLLEPHFGAVKAA